MASNIQVERLRGQRKASHGRPVRLWAPTGTRVVEPTASACSLGEGGVDGVDVDESGLGCRALSH